MKDNKVLKIVANVVLDIVLVLAVVILGFFAYFKISFDTAVVIGPSMYPTLNSSEVQDVVAIKKGSSFTYADIVTAKPSELGGKIIIKRVIALAGDYVDLSYNGSGEVIVLLNGEELSEPYIKDRAQISNCVAYTNWEALRISQSERFNSPLGYEVKEGEVFLMGDNREASSDSTKYGAFKSSSVMGKVEYKYSKNENDFFAFIKKWIFKAK